jgi:hypothetical protein
MKTKLLLATGLFVTALFATGCATRVTASGGRETTLLGGAVTVATDSFQPPTPATAVDTDTSKLVSAGNPTGKKTTLLWGLITLHDY